MEVQAESGTPFFFAKNLSTLAILQAHKAYHHYNKTEKLIRLTIRTDCARRCCDEARRTEEYLTKLNVRRDSTFGVVTGLQARRPRNLRSVSGRQRQGVFLCSRGSSPKLGLSFLLNWSRVLLPSGQSNRGVKLPAHIHPVTRLRVCVEPYLHFPACLQEVHSNNLTCLLFFISIIR
jgi:hypothetical protein